MTRWTDDLAWASGDEFACEADFEQASWLEAAFGLEPLPAVCQRNGGVGATRYIYAASFQPEWVVTCVWRKSGLVGETAFGASSFYDSHQQFDPAKVQHRRRFVSFSLLPWPFHRFGHMKAAAEAAPSCSTACLDGFGAYHMLWESGRLRAAGWDNPHPVRQKPQCALVWAYALMGFLFDFRWPL